MSQRDKRTGRQVSAGQLAARIRGLCLQQGWSPARLAQQAGISRTTLHHLQHGATQRPHAETLAKLAAALGVPVEELTGSQPWPTLESRNTENQADRAWQRTFDRNTNRYVEEVYKERPDLFRNWTAAEWDELYSTFGTGGSLNRQGVLKTAERINRKRQTVQQLEVVLETHLEEVASNLIATLYRMVAAEANLKPNAELTAVIEKHRSQDEASFSAQADPSASESDDHEDWKSG